MSLPPAAMPTLSAVIPWHYQPSKEVVSLILEERLYEELPSLEMRALRFMKEIQDSTEIVGDVRGKGLMIGVELVKDRATKKPAVRGAEGGY
ncbi:MAG: hypothetical protein Q9N34_00505 [Aquificota bacterium]|nr:hypothetical protein [Aquificota bacterium]